MRLLAKLLLVGNLMWVTHDIGTGRVRALTGLNVAGAIFMIFELRRDSE